MGGTTNFRFPLPHRRQKEKVYEVQSISAPMTNKVQKLLGAADINVDAKAPTPPTNELSRRRETGSALSAMSVVSLSVSESTISRPPVHTLAEDTAGPSSRDKTRASCDQESDIIPQGLGSIDASPDCGHNLDTITEASSLRRGRSSSTIVPNYDKSKLPLSKISGQMANSAITQGPTDKAIELLDLDNPRPAPWPPKVEKKKANRLGISHLLPGVGTSSRKALSRLAQKGTSIVLGPDLMMRFAYSTSTSPAESPPEIEPRPRRKAGKKLTMESRLSLHSVRTDRTGAMSPDSVASATLRKRFTDTGTLSHLYEHYEHSSSPHSNDGDACGPRPESRQNGRVTEPKPGPRAVPPQGQVSLQSLSAARPPPPPPKRPRHLVAPSLTAAARQPYTAVSPDLRAASISPSEVPISATNSSLASPLTDYSASLSSRYTRTSKASKRTNMSFTDFDPNNTSVLSLSSESEEDDTDPSRTAVSVPSLTSRDSTSSPADSRRLSNTSIPHEPVRTKNRFRPNDSSPRLRFISEHFRRPAPSPPSINPRTSSLGSARTPIQPLPGMAPSRATTLSSIRSSSRLSRVSSSTSGSMTSQPSRPQGSTDGVSSERSTPHIAMLQTHTTRPRHHHHIPASVVERRHNSPRIRTSPCLRNPSRFQSPSDMHPFLWGQDSTESKGRRPAMTRNNGTGAHEDERFMAVTRQEQLLLAAMRARRAAMRGRDQTVDTVGEENGCGSQKKTTTKKVSPPIIKTEKADDRLCPPPLNLGPCRDNGGNNPPRTMVLAKPPLVELDAAGKLDFGPGKCKEVQTCLDDNTSTTQHLDRVGLSPHLSDWTEFDDSMADWFPIPPNSSTLFSDTGETLHECMPPPVVAGKEHSSQAKAVQQRSNPSPEASLRHRPTVDCEQPFCRQEQRSRAACRPGWRPKEMEPGATKDDELGARKKVVVRVSAVGLQLPELAQWGDDG